MAITSWEFAALVLLAAIVYFAVPHRWQNAWLLLVSYLFYLSYDWRFVLILIGMTVANFLLAKRIEKAATKGWLWAGVILNLLVLAALKYFDFFAAQFPPLSALGLIFSVGLSFLVLQAISYLIDVSRKQMLASSSLLDFALYLAYFPKLISGPLERARSFLPILAAPRMVTADHLGRAFLLVVIGLVRKVLIADALFRLLPRGFFEAGLEQQNPPLIIVTVIADGFAVFNDFAGYTGIVRGVSLVFGIELSQNFLQPYFARNFTEFWNGWHITLSQWLRDYIYFPAARALLRRNSNPRFILNILLPPMLTMLASGLWHNASSNLLVWGGLHGAFLAIERVIAVWTPSTPPDKLPMWRQVGGAIIVFVMVMLAWIPFSASVPTSWHILQGLIQWNVPIESVPWRVFFFIIPALALDWAQSRSGDELVFRRWPLPVQATVVMLLFVLAVMAVMLGAPRQFVYQAF